MGKTPIGENQYRCYMCGGVFDKGWTDDEADAELKAKFPDTALIETEVVCDDCYKEMGF